MFKTRNKPGLCDAKRIFALSREGGTLTKRNRVSQVCTNITKVCSRTCDAAADSVGIQLATCSRKETKPN